MELPDDLANRELLVFAGKGGVGKTTTSSAVALGLARSGKKVLLVTVDPAKRLKDALGVDVGHRTVDIEPNLQAMMLDPEKVIGDFLRENYPDQALTEHPMYRYVTNYLPGINEVIAIGKLLEFRQEKNLDVIVVDTAPTGHALSFLTSPMAIRDVFQENTLLRWAIRGYSLYQKFARSGRMLGQLLGQKEKIPEAPDVDFEDLFAQVSAHVGQIHELLSDHKRTTLNIVTLPEKLPVEETIDLYKVITERLGIRVGYIVVNKVQPDALGKTRADFDRLRDDAGSRLALRNVLSAGGYSSDLEASMVESAEFNEVRRAMNEAHLEDLAKRLPDVPRVVIPLHRRDVNGIGRLGAFWEEFARSLADAAS